MIKGRDHHYNNHHHGKGAPAAADLLVCFPSRAHLSLMPKPICSPARPPEPGKRLHHHPRKIPLMWPAAKSKSISSGGGRDELASEPTSPKVTCAGQIKVRHKAAPCKSWQSVMEEIEKLHVSNNRRRENEKKRRAGGWSNALGLKREVVQFLTCLRTFRLDFRCFVSFPRAGSDVTSSDDDDEEEELEMEEDHQTESSSRTVFSKWFMVLQEEQKIRDDRIVVVEDEPAVPPPNALLLMRCRSAPAKSWEEAERERGGGGGDDDVASVTKEESKRSLRLLMDDEDVKKTTEKASEEEESSVVVMYRNRVCDISSDISNETWIVGGIKDVLSRSRSWKR